METCELFAALEAMLTVPVYVPGVRVAGSVLIRSPVVPAKPAARKLPAEVAVAPVTAKGADGQPAAVPVPWARLAKLTTAY